MKGMLGKQSLDQALNYVSNAFLEPNTQEEQEESDEEDGEEAEEE